MVVGLGSMGVSVGTPERRLGLLDFGMVDRGWAAVEKVLRGGE